MGQSSASPVWMLIEKEKWAVGFFRRKYLVERILNSWHAGYFFHAFSCRLLTFFSKLTFSKDPFRSRQHYQSVKQFGSRSGPTERRSWSWSKLFAKANSRRQKLPLARKEFIVDTHFWASLTYGSRQNWCPNLNTFLPFSFNIWFGCSKEVYLWDSSFEYPLHMFWLRNKKNIFWLLLSILKE